jgi:hypothetical protein
MTWDQYKCTGNVGGGKTYGLLFQIGIVRSVSFVLTVSYGFSFMAAFQALKSLTGFESRERR